MVEYDDEYTYEDDDSDSDFDDDVELPEPQSIDDPWWCGMRSDW